MAGRAHDFAQVAHAAVDGGDHAQRDVHFVEHRALLDVHFDKAQVLRRVALDFGDVVDVQARVLHGRTHGDAVGVLLVQPFWLEVSDQGARAQEGGFVALAFFFGKGHDLDAKGQALALLVQLLHTSHGHKDA